MDLVPYTYAWLFLLLSAVGVSFIYGLSLLRAKRSPTPEKNLPYECGVNSIPSSAPIHPRFYVIAVLFVLFDIELALFFPWAAAFSTIGWDGLLSVFLLLGFLGLGFVYEWKKGTFEWM